MRIKQPIGAKLKFALGVVGIAVLCLGYYWLSYQQHQRNPTDTTIPNFSQLVDGFNR